MTSNATIRLVFTRVAGLSVGSGFGSGGAAISGEGKAAGISRLQCLQTTAAS